MDFPQKQNRRCCVCCNYSEITYCGSCKSMVPTLYIQIILLIILIFIHRFKKLRFRVGGGEGGIYFVNNFNCFGCQCFEIKREFCNKFGLLKEVHCDLRQSSVEQVNVRIYIFISQSASLSICLSVRPFMGVEQHDSRWMHFNMKFGIWVF